MRRFEVGEKLTIRYLTDKPFEVTVVDARYLGSMVIYKLVDDSGDYRWIDEASVNSMETYSEAQ